MIDYVILVLTGYALGSVPFGVIVGWAATPDVAKGKGQRGAPNANMLPTNLIMMKGLQVLGCPTVIATKNNPAIRQERLAAITQWADEGKLTPWVCKTFPLSEFKAAMRLKWTGKGVGGCVLHP